MHLLEVQVQEENHMLNILDHNVLHYRKLKATFKKVIYDPLFHYKIRVQ